MTNVPDIVSMFNPNASYKENNIKASENLAADPEMGLSNNNIAKAIEDNRIKAWGGGSNLDQNATASDGGGGGGTTATAPETSEAPKKFDLESYVTEARTKYKKEIAEAKKSGIVDNIFGDKLKKDIMNYEGMVDKDGDLIGLSEIGTPTLKNVLDQISTGEGFKAKYNISTEYIDRGQSADPAKTAEIRSKNEQIKTANAIMKSTFESNLKEATAARADNQATLDKLNSYLPEGANAETFGIVNTGVGGLREYTPRIEMPVREPVYQPLLDDGTGQGKSKLMTKYLSGGDEKDAPTSGPPRPKAGDHDVWGSLGTVVSGVNGDYLNTKSLMTLRPSQASEHYTTGASAAITNAFQSKVDKDNVKEFDMSLWNNVLGDGFAKNGDDPTATGQRAIAKLSAEAGFGKFYNKDGSINRQETAKSFATNGNNVLLTVKDKNGKWVEAEIPANVKGMAFTPAGIKKLNAEYGFKLKDGATWHDLMKTKNAEYRVNQSKYEGFTQGVSNLTQNKLSKTKLDNNARQELKNNLSALTTISLINGLRYVD